MIISKNEQIVILNRILDIPPYNWLGSNFTPSQLQNWQCQKAFYGLLHEELTSFFSGYAFDLESRLKSCLPNNYHSQLKELVVVIKTWRAYYIELYTLLRECWYCFKTALETAKYNNKFNQKYKITLETILRCNTPGELLAACIEDDCRKSFKQCTEYTECQPKQMRTLLLEGRKIHELMQKPSLSKSEMLKIKNFKLKIKRHVQKTNHIPSICLQACEVHLKNHDDPNIQNQLKKYKSQLLTLMATQSGLLHPDKHRKGFKWHNGELLNLS